MVHLGIYSYVEFLYKVYLKESSDHRRSTSFEGSEEQGRVKKLKLQKLKDQPSRDTRNLPMQEHFRSSQARHGKASAYVADSGRVLSRCFAHIQIACSLPKY